MTGQTRRALVALGAGIALSVAMIAHLALIEQRAEAVEITSGPVPLDPEDPERTRFGSLTYTGGLVLTAPAERFGGYSALAADPADEALILISDRGTWLRAVPRWQAGRLTGLSAAGDLMPVPGPDGRPERGRKRRDTESAALLPSRLMLAFEQDHRLLAFPRRPDDPTLATILAKQPRPWGRLPAAAQEMPSNGGFEAVAATKDGRVLAWSEDLRTEAGHARGWLISDEAAPQPVYLASDGPHKPTGLTALPKGGYLMLMRHFSPLSGVSIRLIYLPPGAVAAEAVIEPVTLAEFGPRFTIDNMEGIAAVGIADGVRIYLISDDNFNPFQRTLLLSFRLDDGDLAAP